MIRKLLLNIFPPRERITQVAHHKSIHASPVSLKVMLSIFIGSAKSVRVAGEQRRSHKN